MHNNRYGKRDVKSRQDLVLVAKSLTALSEREKNNATLAQRQAVLINAILALIDDKAVTNEVFKNKLCLLSDANLESIGNPLG